MKQIQTMSDVYPAVDALIIELKTAGHFKLADTLHHRMHQVAWTTGSELLEELQNVLLEAQQLADVSFSEPIRHQLQQIIDVISNWLVSRSEWEFFKRLVTAIGFIREGKWLSVGNILLQSDEDAITLNVIGWTRSIFLEEITQKSVLDELAEVIKIYNKMLEICPRLLDFAWKPQVRFFLNYGCEQMDSVRICSSKDGVVRWHIDLKP